MIINGLLVAGLVIAVFIALFALGCAFEANWDTKPAIIVAIVCVIVAWGISCGVALVLTSLVGDESCDNTVTYQKAAREFGFSSGNKYPLILGARSGGSSGYINGTFYLGMFGGSGNIEGKTSPTSMFPVSFEYGDATNMLDIPTVNTTFKKVASQADTGVVIKLNTEQYATAISTTTTKHRRGSISWWNLLLYYTDIASDPVTVKSTLFKEKGLAPIIQQGISSCTVYLTSEQYDQLLGKIK
ncbi:hypothetical protein FWF48_01315 [Candidatus Saccharibacteria bacterium]|nr:hypothetical protein [Candidatus Saccharibacteria bacterium]